MSENWSREEVEATASDYFDMLSLELRGEPFNKAEHNRRLQGLLNSRTKGSIERKHQNISAVLIELGYPYIDGYKPLGNYQALLRDVIEDRLFDAANLHRAAAAAVEHQVESIPRVPDILSILIPPPRQEEQESVIYDRPVPASRGTRKNYLEIEARNQSLGVAGEKFALEFEHARLWRAGKRDLADRIEHTAATKGDGLGYDILSFESDGRERLIEVKTTQFGIQTPFFATSGEVGFSQAREKEYHLYRLFNFVRQPRLFVLQGSLRETCLLNPALYAASPR
jgi:hypothetical protein